MCSIWNIVGKLWLYVWEDAEKYKSQADTWALEFLPCTFFHLWSSAAQKS